MKHLGDITKISGYNAPVVDVITGGSPCQDLSIAGKRAGLQGERSGLFMEQIRIIKEMRERDLQNGTPINDIRPRYMVWENVPGAFSSNKGEDFRAVLEETAKVKDPTISIPGYKKWTNAGCIMGDGFSIAWRTHDAQFWGVPQRRKRISLVADFNGDTAAEILFESYGVQGDIEKGRKQGEGTSKDVEGRADKPIYDVRISTDGTKNWRAHCYETNISRSLDTAGENPDSNHGGVAIIEQNVCGVPLGFRAENTRLYDEKGTTLCNGTRPGYTSGVVIGLSRERCGAVTSEEVMPTIQAAAGESGNNQPMVCQPIPYQKTTGALMASGYNKLGTQEALNDMYVVTTSHGGFMVDADESGVAHTLQSTDYKDAPVVSYGVDCYNQSQTKEKSKPLTSVATDSDHIPCVYGQSSFASYEEKVSTLKANGGDIGGGSENLCVNSSVVRRLTPLECERLQGFPDNWTDIGDWIDSKGKKHKGESDAPRYKALGNSIALPFWQWLAERICRNIENPTMASLFDGIGGFPLVFSRVGCEPVWASEIEEFPIAVTKIRFGEDQCS